jgi:hypothetical protein
MHVSTFYFCKMLRPRGDLHRLSRACPAWKKRRTSSSIRIFGSVTHGGFSVAYHFNRVFRELTGDSLNAGSGEVELARTE